MIVNLRDFQTRLTLIGVIVLVIGFGSAVLVYQQALKQSREALAYDEDSGSFYPVRPEDTKKYIRDLEFYGGRANVLTDRFRRWFIGLWQGESLAFIIASLSILAGCGFFYAARRYPPEAKRNAPDEESPGKRDAGP